MFNKLDTKSLTNWNCQQELKCRSNSLTHLVRNSSQDFAPSINNFAEYIVICLLKKARIKMMPRRCINKLEESTGCYILQRLCNSYIKHCSIKQNGDDSVKVPKIVVYETARLSYTYSSKYQQKVNRLTSHIGLTIRENWMLSMNYAAVTSHDPLAHAHQRHHERNNHAIP
jgi:hypothetical protein